MSFRFDLENQLCVAQAFTGLATVSTNAFEKGTAAQDLSIGDGLSLAVYPLVNAGVGSTHVLEAIQADNAALTANVEVIGTVTLPAAQLVKGKEIEIPIRAGSMSRRYIGFRNTATGGTTTVTLDVYLMSHTDIAVYKSFPKVVSAGV